MMSEGRGIRLSRCLLMRNLTPPRLPRFFFFLFHFSLLVPLQSLRIRSGICGVRSVTWATWPSLAVGACLWSIEYAPGSQPQWHRRPEVRSKETIAQKNKGNPFLDWWSLNPLMHNIWTPLLMRNMGQKWPALIFYVFSCWVSVSSLYFLKSIYFITKCPDYNFNILFLISTK